MAVRFAGGESVRWGKQEVTTNDMEIVSALQLALADKVGQERFDLWFGAHTRLELHDAALTVRVPNQFLQDLLRGQFRSQLEACCLETLGTPVAVRFSIDPSLSSASSGIAAPAPGSASDRRGVKPPLSVAGGSASGEDQAAQRRRRFADFESFVVGDGNRVAHAASQAVALRLGSASPLVVHGPTSVGKTHLLEAVWTAARKTSSRIQAVYLSAEQFTSLFLGALHGGGLPSFRRKYRGLELLIIDDLQFLAGKKATLVELLHTIDTFLREGRQLVFAADRAPAELASLGLELTTRLQGGLVCGIQPPDYETRLGIVARLAGRLQLQVGPEVQQYLAASLNSHARELCGALHRLEATSRALDRPISLELAQDALADLIRHSSRSVRLADIERAVCDVFGLEPRTLQSNRKGREASHPRMLAMWLARKHTRAALSEIGHHFGRRSHSTVVSAQKKVNGWMSSRACLALADSSCQIEEAIRRVEANLRAG